MNFKTQTMKKQLLILMTLFIASIGNSQTFTENFITYQVLTNTSNVTITNYDVVGGTVVDIPATVTNNNNTYNITVINTNAFSNKGLTSISMVPNSITSIGNGAFALNQLNTVVIPNGVITIGVDAFYQNALTSIDIADSVTSIGTYSFAENNISDFSNVTLSNGLTTLPENCFSDNQLTNLIIPNSITVIGEGAFENNSLANLIMHNGVITIDSGAFKNNLLTSITIPDTVTLINSNAFNNNPLTDITSLSVTPPTIETGSSSDSFATDRSNIHLHIPPGTMGAYVTNAGALWTGFNPVTEDSSLSLTNFELSKNISIYPNPAQSQIQLISNETMKSVTIIDLFGKTIKSNLMSTSSIDISDLSKGVYFLRIYTDKGMAIKKIIKD